jgi:hypothetical protein
MFVTLIDYSIGLWENLVLNMSSFLFAVDGVVKDSI